MQREREEAGTHIRYLEGKQKDMQDIMVVKLRELNAARDAQLPLKAEIEALRALLHEEERRYVGIIVTSWHGSSFCITNFCDGNHRSQSHDSSHKGSGFPNKVTNNGSFDVIAGVSLKLLNKLSICRIFETL